MISDFCVVFLFFFVFFFKQKTAYEMRISDWSSDVCSSDLHYHFVDEAEFERMVEAGDFFEHARVHGDWKGTARQSVEPQLASGKDVLLEIEIGRASCRERVCQYV